jgi:hypothetical protein
MECTDCASSLAKKGCYWDIVAGLNTEAYRIQARAFTTGSDGLADLPEDSLKTIIMPKIQDKDARQIIQAYMDALLEGRSTVAQAVSDLMVAGKAPKIDVRARSHHVVLV